MCQQCLEAARRHFPDCPDDQVGTFLMGATAFPMGGPEIVERQLIEAKAAGCESWEAAMAYSDERCDIEMREIYERQECDAMMRV